MRILVSFFPTYLGCYPVNLMQDIKLKKKDKMHEDVSKKKLKRRSLTY